MSDAPETPDKGKTLADKPKVATIKTAVTGVQARGFTFARGAVVAGVSEEFADRLEKQGKASVIDLTTP